MQLTSEQKNVDCHNNLKFLSQILRAIANGPEIHSNFELEGYSFILINSKKSIIVWGEWRIEIANLFYSGKGALIHCWESDWTVGEYHSKS